MMEFFKNTSSGRFPEQEATHGNLSVSGMNVTMDIALPCIHCFTLAAFYLVALAFTVVVLSLVMASKALPRVIRFVLANILIASFAAGFGVLVIVLARITATRVRYLSLSLTTCQYFIVMVSIGGTSRPLIMVVFAVVVYIIIKYSISAVKLKYLVICTLAVWLVCGMFNATLLSPDVMHLHSLQGTGCVPRFGPSGPVFSVPFFVCVLFIPFALNVVLLIASFRYVRANTVSETAASLKPMLKFSVFLLLGTLLSTMGQTTPVIASYINSPALEVLNVINRSNAIIILLSIIPTPILVLVYFRPVRIPMKRGFLSVCRNVCNKSLRSSGQPHLTDRMLAFEVV